MDVLAVKQACKFAKEHALENGPIVSVQETLLLSIIWIMCIYVLLGTHQGLGFGWSTLLVE